MEFVSDAGLVASPLTAFWGATPLHPMAAITTTASSPFLITMHLLRLGLGNFA